MNSLRETTQAILVQQMLRSGEALQAYDDAVDNNAHEVWAAAFLRAFAGADTVATSAGANPLVIASAGFSHATNGRYTWRDVPPAYEIIETMPAVIDAAIAVFEPRFETILTTLSAWLADHAVNLQSTAAMMTALLNDFTAAVDRYETRRAELQHPERTDE